MISGFQNWLHIRITWGTFKDFNAQSHPNQLCENLEDGTQSTVIFKILQVIPMFNVENTALAEGEE